MNYKTVFTTILIAVAVICIFSLDNLLAITIAFIFISAFVGFFIKIFGVDKCLKDFVDDRVTIEYSNKKTVCGAMEAYSNGMELFFKEPSKDNKYSFIFYKNEYPNLNIIYRYQDELSVENQKNREECIKEYCKPNARKAFIRNFQNILGLFCDALSQTISILIGSVKSSTPATKVLKNQKKQITSMSSDIMGYAGNIYDPILEKYIGHKVIIEMVQGENIIEYQGILKDYTANFLEILNISIDKEFSYNFDGELLDNNIQAPLKIQKQEKFIKITNTGATKFFIKNLTFNNKEIEIEKEVVQTNSITIDSIDEAEANNESDSIVITILRQADIIVPRSHAVVRNAGDKQKTAWKDLFEFDFIKSGNEQNKK